jgi:hypothetical protein
VARPAAPRRLRSLLRSEAWRPAPLGELLLGCCTGGAPAARAPQLGWSPFRAPGEGHRWAGLAAPTMRRREHYAGPARLRRSARFRPDRPPNGTFTVPPAGNDTSPESFLLHNALARKPKRIRTAFSPSQLLRLEHAFEKNHYVVGAERKQLAHSLSLTETQVSAAQEPGHPSRRQPLTPSLVTHPGS